MPTAPNPARKPSDERRTLPGRVPGAPREPALSDKSGHPYGGALMKTVAGRKGSRPLAYRYTMHLILRSTRAVGGWSLRKTGGRKGKINAIIEKFARKHGIKIYSIANVGNHLHLQLKLSNRVTYKAFIRAVTASIAMLVTGASRLKPFKKAHKDRFWDYRPFTRIVTSYKYFENLRRYIQISQIQGYGNNKADARLILAWIEAKEGGLNQRRVGD